MKVVVAGREFPTRRDADNEFRRLLRMPIGTIYFPGCPEFAFLHGYIETHSDATAKIGPGVSFFRVMANQIGSGHGWEVARSDGSTVGFSYKECLRTQPKECHWSDFSSGCRVEVADQIAAFKSSLYSTPSVNCSLCYKPVAPRDCDVDHVPPLTFKVLVAGFTASNGIDPRTVLYVESGPACPDAFADRPMAIAWQQYHAQNATMQVVHRACHKKETKKRRESEVK